MLSKSLLQTLLYPGATTKIGAHFMAWFDGKNHIDVGYKSNDIVKLRSQIEQMHSIGITWCSIDWYGFNNTFIDSVTKMFKAECESRKDFQFAIMADDGLFNSLPKGMNVTDYLIQQLKYAQATYMVSPQYLKDKLGRFIVFEFGMSQHNPDWTRVQTALPKCAFIHRNTVGFAVPKSAGAYAWLDSSRSDTGYLVDFLKKSATFSNMISIPSIWKGFDDRKASWSKNRVVDGRNGDLYLECFDAINQVFSETNQLEWLQLVTWNDYEEGTAFEAGVENGIKLAASKTGSNVAVSILAGNQRSIESYELWLGERLIGPYSSFDLNKVSTACGTYPVVFNQFSKPLFLDRQTDPITATLAWS